MGHRRAVAGSPPDAGAASVAALGLGLRRSEPGGIRGAGALQPCRTDGGEQVAPHRALSEPRHIVAHVNARMRRWLIPLILAVLVVIVVLGALSD